MRALTMAAPARFVAVALLALLAGKLAWPVSVPLGVLPGAPAATPDPTAPGLPARGREALTGILLERPLFSPDRRPPRGGTIAVPTPEPGPAPHLTGTIISGLGRTALFTLPGEARPVAAREGDRVGRFRVAAIGRDEVSVTGPDGPLVWRMQFGSETAPVALAPDPPVVTEQLQHTRGNDGQHAE